MTDWLKGCEVCNAGLCARFDELLESGKSQREAAAVLVDEQKKELGAVVYPAETLRTRFNRTQMSLDNYPISETLRTRFNRTKPQKKKVVSNDTKKSPEINSTTSDQIPKPRPRNPNIEKEIITESFKQAWDRLYAEITNERHAKWKNMPKKTVIRRIEMLLEIATR